MRRRVGSAERRPPSRQSKPLVLVVCAGERTEPAYFKGLRDFVASRAVDIKLVARPKAPVQMVEFAGTRGTGFDEVWCVFDVDNFDIATAVQVAGEFDVQLGVSNPCFELWLLLHLEDCRARLDGYKAVAAKLRKHFPAYDKAQLRFADFVTGLDEAVARARALDETGTKFEENPTTSVWRLVERITG